MAYIIPNSTDTGSGQRFANINQAEPDSVDIEALGNRANWVRSGCALSIDAETLTVGAGVVVVNNVPYTCSGGTIPLDRASIGARTYLIVARLSNGTITVVKESGVDTATNPVFPKSTSVVITEDPNGHYYHPDTDVLLATVYASSAAITNANLVDKRIVDPSPVIRTVNSAAVPSNNTYDVIGDTIIASNGIMYVKTGASTWSAMSTQAYANSVGFPIGSIFVWTGTGSPGANYLPCNGQDVSSVTYPGLWTVLGTRYSPTSSGSSTTTVTLPNLNNGSVPTGTTGTSLIGQSVGSNTLSLSVTNLPSHKHIVNNTLNLSHGSIAHTRSGSSSLITDNEGGESHRHHGHYHGHQGALMYRRYDNHNSFHVHNVSHGSSDAFHVDAYHVDEEGNPNNPYAYVATPDNTAEEAYDAPANRFERTSNVSPFDDSQMSLTGTGSPHSHTFTVDNHNIPSHTLTENYVPPLGGQVPANITPKGVYMRWYIRAL